MKTVDKAAIEQFGIPGIALMENAGRAAAMRCSRILEQIGKKGLVAIFAGKGSNGGDGFVMARYLHNWGYNVEVFLAANCNDIRGDARVNLEICRKLNVIIREEPAFKFTPSGSLDGVCLIVDALLGTGTRGEPREPISSMIREINSQSKKGICVLAVDISSGIDADDGSVPAEAVSAQYTVTMGLLKRGLLLFPGAYFAGEIEVADISLPQAAVSSAGINMKVICPDTLSSDKALLRRCPDTHKGSYGHVLLIAGSRGYTGAACLAAMGALRVGAGLVTVACPQSVQGVVASKITEGMTVCLPEGPDGTISHLAIEGALALTKGKAAVVVGPGLQRTEAVRSLVKELLKRCKAPLVIDADGLSALGQDLSAVRAAVANSGNSPVLTPHPGEMGSLLGKNAREIQRGRVLFANELAREGRCVSVLKGARTLVCDKEMTYMNVAGNPGMASGGMGDVLTGIIAGLIAQGATSVTGSLLGVYLHAKAADAAALRVGQNALLASDLLDDIGPQIEELMRCEGDGKTRQGISFKVRQ